VLGRQRRRTVGRPGALRRAESHREPSGAGATYADTCISEVRLLEYGAERTQTCDPQWCAGPGKGHDGCAAR